MEGLWRSGQLTSSRFYLSHCSDMLRFLLIHKFGGIYFDQDVLSLKPIPGELSDRNFLVEERDDILASAVFKMDRGHPIMETVLKLMVRLSLTKYVTTSQKIKSPLCLFCLCLDSTWSSTTGISHVEILVDSEKTQMIIQ